MKKLTYIALAASAALGAFAFQQSAFADDMAGMKMSAGAMSPAASSSSKSALTDAEIRKVDPASGMVTLKHGAGKRGHAADDHGVQSSRRRDAETGARRG